jgi:hypothetical protein
MKNNQVLSMIKSFMQAGWLSISFLFPLFGFSVLYWEVQYFDLSSLFHYLVCLDDIDLDDPVEKTKDQNLLAALNKKKLASKFQAFTGHYETMFLVITLVAGN